MYAKMDAPRMSPHRPRVALWLHNYQPKKNEESTNGVGFHTVRGDIQTGAHRFCRRFVGDVDVLEGFAIRGWDLVLHGCSGTSMLPYPISDKRIRLEFPHRAGLHRPGGPTLCPQLLGCRCME